VPGSLQRHQLPARGRSKRGAGRVRADGVLAAVDDHHRTANPPAALPKVVRRRQCARDVNERLGIGIEAPADAVLDLLRRMGLREHPSEEELEEAAVVLHPVVPVQLRPSVIGVVAFLERVARALGMARGERRGRADVDDPVDALGMVGGKQGSPENSR
jgi:hypothetical protein